MKVRLTFKQGPGSKPRVIETEVNMKMMTLGMMRQLVEMEQFLNALPGATWRVHMETPIDGDGN